MTKVEISVTGKGLNNFLSGNLKSVQKGARCRGSSDLAQGSFQRSSVPPRSPLHYQLENGGATIPYTVFQGISVYRIYNEISCRGKVIGMAVRYIGA